MSDIYLLGLRPSAKRSHCIPFNYNSNGEYAKALRADNHTAWFKVEGCRLFFDPHAKLPEGYSSIFSGMNDGNPQQIIKEAQEHSGGFYDVFVFPSPFSRSSGILAIPDNIKDGAVITRLKRKYSQDHMISYWTIPHEEKMIEKPKLTIVKTEIKVPETTEIAEAVGF